MNIPIQVTVDLIQEYQLFTFTAKQKDIGRSAVITVTANGQVIPVTEADGANIYIAKPDGTKVYNACSFDNGRVVAELTSQMLASAGTAKVELELGAASGSRITTPIFNLKVLPTQIDGTAIESSNEFTALQQALLQVGEIATMRADIGDLTNLKTTAKSSLVDAINEQNSKFAPAGYGFGENAIAVSSVLLKSEVELDAALETIYSKMESGKTKLIRFSGYPDNSDYNWYGFLFKSSTNYGSLIMQSSYAKGSLITKAKFGGAWQPLEWVNPRMLPGVEYRTTERWNDKPVYTQLVNCGFGPNNTQKAIAFAYSVIRCFSFCDAGGGYTISLPLNYGESKVTCHHQSGTIIVYANYDVSSYTVYAQVWYTKD